MNKKVKRGDPMAFELDILHIGLAMNLTMTKPPEISHEKGTIELHLDGRFYDSSREY